MSIVKSVVILSLISLLFIKTDGLLLDLFGEKDRHGLSIRLDVSESECSNLPVSWASKAASINTLGSCVQLYDEPFCKGSLTVIQPFHTIHQMDMSLINFANRIQSASACGPKIKTGRYVIQNAADATILSVSSKIGGFARAFTTNTSKVINKGQQWEIIELGNSDYTLKPREFGDNFPISYDEASLKKGQIRKKMWKLMSVGRGRYLIKNEPTQRCLYKTEENKVEEHDCRIWSPNQEWVFREIYGNLKSEKSNSAAVGPGINFNILSKVASYRPPTKPPPQYAPIFFNASTLAQFKRKSTAAPYVIRKKIKRGPRPKSKPIPLLNQLRPPGLRLKPALPEKVANNNKFLLLKQPNTLNYNVLNPPPEFVPTDDRVESYAYYQQILLAQAQAEALKAKYPPPPLPPVFPPTNSKLNLKKNKKKDNDDSEDEEDENQEEDDEDTKKTSQDDEESDEEGDINDDEEEQDDEPQREQKRPQRPEGPDFNNNQFNHNQTAEIIHQDDASGFLNSFYSKVKSGIGSVTSFSLNIPFISSSSDSGATNLTHPYGEDDRYSHYPPHGPPPQGPEPDYYQDEPPRPSKKSKRKGHRPGLRLPKRKSSTTTTTEKPSLWGYFG